MLDNQKIKICEYECEVLEEERVLYFSELDKIAVLNGTASFIWDFIVENALIGVSSRDVVEALDQHYHLSDTDKETILGDVEDFLNLLMQEKLIMINGIN